MSFIVAVSIYIPTLSARGFSFLFWHLLFVDILMMVILATHMAESEEELKSLLWKVKEENEKVGLKLNTHTTKITISGPITSWQIGKQWKQ